MTLWGKIKTTILIIIGVTPIVSLVWMIIAGLLGHNIGVPMLFTILPGLIAIAIFGGWSWWSTPYALKIYKRQRKH